MGTSALFVNKIDAKTEGKGVSVCPGPNMAYFSKLMSLNEITDHIYGRENVISRGDRPNMFVKELTIYIDYLKNKIEEAKDSINKKQEIYLTTFAKNLNEGIAYYESLFSASKETFKETKSIILGDLNSSRNKLQLLHVEIGELVALNNAVSGTT